MLNLDRSSIETANDLSQFNAGDVLAREAESIYAQGLDELAEMVDGQTLTERQQAIFEERRAGWKELCEKSYNDVIRRRASWVPWTVTGPAGYNSRRNEKRADAQIKAGVEWDEKRRRYLDNTAAMLREAKPVAEIVEEYRAGKCREPISADDPHAAEKLAARIEFLKAQHERGKAKNAWYRKRGTMKGFDNLTDEQAARADAAIQDPNTLYHVPYAPYEVQNNLANIKRLEQRLAEIQQQRQRASDPAEGAPENHNGFTVEQSAESNRLVIRFEDKPDADAREILKSNGFHWSPRAQVWQRQLTENARRAVRRYVVPALEKLDAYKPAQEEQEAADDLPEEITLDEFAAMLRR